jgi:hypothetical protein
MKKRYASRTRQTFHLENISPKERPYLGYLVASRLKADQSTLHALSYRLLKRLPEELKPSQRDDVLERARLLHDSEIATWRSRFGKLKDELYELDRRVTAAQDTARRNTLAYLASEYVDVYVATSMRESWEFENITEFTRELFGDPSLAPLHLRFFDPTLSHLTDRIDKGLVEALMLKRARCTIYMTQELDTLGKDSELASTLAQGKPVIAYIPQVTPAEVQKSLANAPVRMITQRLTLMLTTEHIQAKLRPTAAALLSELLKFQPLFKLAGDEDKIFRKNHRTEIEQVIDIIAQAEPQYFESRAKTLLRIHPLSLQVNLDTGVANGLLVARSSKECASILKTLLLNEGKFHIEKENSVSVLRLSNEAPFRVVTDDPTLTNAFWQLYKFA